MILICTQALYKSRKTLPEKTFDHVTRTCKKVITRSANSEQVRHLIGEAPQQWKDFHDLFALAIPVLEAQSLAAEVPHTGAAALSSALMALNHDTLMKDLERLNDILIIARNVLATTQKVQDLAGESQLDQQILKLIDLCVRVTARGYDGDSGSRTELQWGNVITSCKLLCSASFRSRVHSRPFRSTTLPKLSRFHRQKAPRHLPTVPLQFRTRKRAAQAFALAGSFCQLQGCE